MNLIIVGYNLLFFSEKIERKLGETKHLSVQREKCFLKFPSKKLDQAKINLVLQNTIGLYSIRSYVNIYEGKLLDFALLNSVNRL